MKKTIFISLMILTASHSALADHVCEGLKIFKESNTSDAVAVLTTQTAQKLFMGSYKPVHMKTGKFIDRYVMKDSYDKPTLIDIDYWFQPSKNCAKTFCDEAFAKYATLVINGEATIFKCQY